MASIHFGRMEVGDNQASAGIMLATNRRRNNNRIVVCNSSWREGVLRGFSAFSVVISMCALWIVDDVGCYDVYKYTGGE